MKTSLLANHLFNEPVMLSESKFDTLINLCLLRSGIDVDMSSAVHKGESSSLQPSKSIAIIPITGTLMHRPSGLQAMSGLCSYAQIDQQLDAALNNDSVKEIVLDINSHGGMVAGAFDQAERIHQASKQKKVTAIVNEAAYSAAFLMAASASRIILPRTAGVGSIGVIAHHVDRSEANEKAGVRITAIYAGERKADLSPDAPLSDQALKVLQQSVDEKYEMFVDAVARYRGLTTEAIRATKAGLFSGDSALRSGLADEVLDAKTALSRIISTRPTTRNIGRRAKAIALNH
ncbi:S49 family peptidase [Vibrio metschnikovii]|nr:S49 family peptidase [Vibrio metschnikovii]